MKYLIILLGSIFLFNPIQAQLQNVVVEKYYISDANDAKNIQYLTDNTGNVIDSVSLLPGSVTYRIYVKLASGYMLTKVFGDQDHALRITSSEVFFNNIDYGVSFGKDLNSSRLQFNSVALDSWLTMGQATKTYSGILKSEDSDGSVLGGSKNSDGMLVNNDPLAGIPLTQSDGLVPAINKPAVWLQNGIINSAGDDSTIFGSLKPGKEFLSNIAFLQSSGAFGADANSNEILVAQLTTAGEISFELNIQVQKSDGSATYTYVAKRAAGDDAKGMIYSSLLSYPRLQSCGCTDPNYMEYNPNADCTVLDSCKTKIVCGCMDPLACNFDSQANFSIPSLCCYPGSCADRDISIVCPNLPPEPQSSFMIYPNPVENQLNIEVASTDESEVKIEIFNSFGRLVLNKSMGVVKGTVNIEFNMSDLNDGIYLARFSVGNKTETKTFIKR